MSIVSSDRIAIGATARNKEDAIRKAGKLLVKSGCVKPAYVDGMLKREESMSTHLGNGVAIPHGVFENRDDILKTGISVLQLSKGVTWDDNDEVRIIIGIAATSDEHVSVLANLANVIDDEEKLLTLFNTKDPKIIVRYLSDTTTN